MKPQDASCHISPNQINISSISTFSRLITCLMITLSVVFVLVCTTNGAHGWPSSSIANDIHKANDQEFLNRLRKSDTCKAIYKSHRSGYEVRKYEIITDDNYILELHRLIHPENKQPPELNEDLPATGQSRRQKEEQLEDALRGKKPYLLVHGLIGTSGSFVINVDDQYQPEPKSFSAKKHIVETLEAKADIFQYEWEATATKQQGANSNEKRDRWARTDKIFAQLNEIIYDGDELNFAREYRQAYRKFHLPTSALPFTTTSLAFTLSNFGYDVWMVNLRGNQYSKGYNGPLTPGRDEYWDFNLETLVKEDLLATINHIQERKKLTDPIGMVTFSYSSAYVLNMLTKHAPIAERVQPIVMLAPTMLTGARDDTALKIKSAIMSRNGPLPSLAQMLIPQKLLYLSSLFNLAKLSNSLASFVCSLPIASQLCHILQPFIQGEGKRAALIRSLLPIDSAAALMRQDNDCGKTSKAMLHQILKNAKAGTIPADFMAFASIALERRRLKTKNSKPGIVQQSSTVASAEIHRRSVILIHSDADEVATPAEVDRIRSTSLKSLTLLDYVIKTPGFGHADFLFSKRNQYLVNAEVVRQVLLFDFLAYTKYANQPSEVPKGIKVPSKVFMPGT